MTGRSIRNWSVISGVLGLGVLVGLVIAGSVSLTPESLAGDLVAVRGADAAAVTALDGRAGRTVPAELLEPAPTVAPQAGAPSYRAAAVKVRPAVVSVHVTRWVSGNVHRGINIDPDQLPEGMREFFRFEMPDEADPEPFQARGEGSGFIFTEDGYIITNNHVVEDAAAVLVVMPDRRQFEAEVVGADPITDVAVLKVDAGRRLPKVDLGDSDAVEVGDPVLALGNPLDFDFTVTAGIVSAKGRGNLNIGPVQNNVRQMIQDFIQTDAAINRGNSGGPLVDLQGRVVGINTAIASQTGFYSGYGFAIPINLAKAIATDLIEHGEVQRSWLGITFNEITADWADAVGLDQDVPYGVVVQSIVAGGPADDAGLEEEDIILSIDGEPVEHSGKLQTVVSTKKPGTRIRVEVFRGGSSERPGERRELTIRLGERPALDGQPQRPAERIETPELVDPLGLEVEDLSRQDRRDTGYRGDGVIIESVEPGHPFGRIEPNPVGEAFLVGAVIVEIDGRPVKDLDGYLEIGKGLKSGDAVLVRFYNPAGNDGDRYNTLAVRLP